MFGAFFHNITFGLFGHVPEKAYGTAEWYRQLWRASRNFAFVADLTVAVLGGGLKTKQKLTGRLADALSELYLLCCVLKRYEDDGKPANDRHIVALAAQNGLFRFQEAMRGTIDNFPVAPVRWLMRAVVFPFGAHYKPAPDWLGHKVVELVLTPGEVRDRLTRFIYVSHNANDPTGLLEVTMAKVVAAEAAEKKLDRAVRAGQVRRVHGTDWIGDAAKLGVITDGEAQLLREVEQLTARVIAVDHFDPAEVKPHYMTAGHNARAMQKRRGRMRLEYHGGHERVAGLAVLDRSCRASPGRCSTARARARIRSAGGRSRSWRAIVERVEQGARDKSIRGLVFISGKEKGFIVGADVREFEQLTDRARRSSTASRLVNAYLDRIERLPVPVVCCIHGFCLGGGLELALACHWRIATRDDATRIGFPEVRLGIFPGFNGTARSIRQAGALSAMPLMLTGSMIRATRRARHGARRRAGAEPAQPALGGAQGDRAQAQVEAGRRLEGRCCGMCAGARAAGQEVPLRDRQEGARGALSRALPPDRPVRDARRQSRGHEGGRDARLRAADGGRHLAATCAACSSSPR